ncbi:CapA family protein [Bacteroides thetaiotaomicron]|jgi:hypothetical protein|uniref:CapA family protein n=1 Tax=Bacteroides thetaiotaomicron TaxID=818 RepID=UPI002166903C|nr:CapA family protein [Bacteroides thetaiotaomicron]MCS3197357.1 CapA family protein [Bacteroides thetaiotaomicron]
MTRKADIFICGDIINQTTDKQFIDSSLIDVIQHCEYSICNFEGTCKSDTLQKGQMLQRESTLQSLKDAGFNMLLLANNHITDYGECGLRQTITSIDQYGFDRMGAGFEYNDVYRPHVLNIAGLKIGIINLCEAQLGQFKEKDQSHGYAWLGDYELDERIRTLRKEVDYLIVIPHAGLESYSVPLKQFRHLYQHWCDLGVDVVVGGHPHISQGIEQYGNSIIFYSLGNFFFTGFNGEIDTWTKGISCVLHFSEKGISYDVIQHRMNDECVSTVHTDINNIEAKNYILANDESYKKALKEQNAIAFEALPMRLYMSALNGTSSCDSLVTKIKKIIFYLINRKSLYAGTEKYRMSVLKRLTENETYRYLTISAIEDQLGENDQRL